MKYVDEYRDPELAGRLLDSIRRVVSREWTVMEVCGGQTHSLLRSGIDRLLDGQVRLLHGPGCPVCVTPLEQIDRGLAIASRPGVIFCSFGDMLRVPGSERDLLRVRAEGGDVRIVYSPLDAVRLACENPGREVVFFAVGFETTTPRDGARRLAGAATRPNKLFTARLARPGAARDGSHPRRSPQPGPGVSRGGACLCRHRV